MTQDIANQNKNMTRQVDHCSEAGFFCLLDLKIHNIVYTREKRQCILFLVLCLMVERNIAKISCTSANVVTNGPGANIITEDH